MRLRWILAIGLAAASLAPARASAMPSNSDTPALVTIVPPSVDAPAPGLGEFTVTVRDLANRPMVGAQVVFDLSVCTDLYLCPNPADPDMVVDCAAKRASKIADAQGSVRMTVLGGSNGAGNAATLSNGGRIYANGTLIGSPTVSAFDLDGTGGLGANDLTAFLTDFASGWQFGRSDYDGTGMLGAHDLSLWLSAFATGTMVASCAVSCP